MWFGAGVLDLLFGGEGEDVVADDVFLAVVLVVAAAFGVVDEVVFHEDAGAALVVVEAPSAVGVGDDMMDVVAADDGAFGGAEGVDGTHVAEEAIADVVDVVVCDEVSFGLAVVVSPAPADGDAGVGEVADVVVGDAVVTAVADPDADGAGEDLAGVADEVVVEGLVAGGGLGCGGEVHGAAAEAAGAEVVEVGLADGVVFASFAEPDAVDAGVGDGGVFDGDVFGVIGLDDGFDGCGGLLGFEAFGRRWPAGVEEADAGEGDVGEFAVGRAFEDEQLLEVRCDDGGGFRGFAGAWLIEEGANFRVVFIGFDEPLAGLVEGGAEVFEDNAGVGVP